MAGCAKPREVDGDLLQNRNGIYYLPNEEKSFTGVAVSKHENGQKKRHETTYKDGSQYGLWTKWHENGQKASEATTKDGIRISLKSWDRDGNLTSGF